MTDKTLKDWRAAQKRWNGANEFNREMVEAGEALFFAGDALAMALDEAPKAETYQGWTNRETRLVNLWLNNEQGLQEDARAACNAEGEMLPEAAQSLKDYVDGLVELQGTSPFGAPDGFIGDLINAALARVNWSEIATHFRE